MGEENYNKNFSMTVKQRDWQESENTKQIKLECLKLALEYGRPVDQAAPWDLATKHYMWIKWGKPNAQVK